MVGTQPAPLYPVSADEASCEVAAVGRDGQAGDAGCWSLVTHWAQEGRTAPPREGTSHASSPSPSTALEVAPDVTFGGVRDPAGLGHCRLQPRTVPHLDSGGT